MKNSFAETKTKTMNQEIKQTVDVIKHAAAGKRILFGCVPADGHFNPLTGIAVHLKSIGYDVRWYTSASYAGSLEKLQIRHYPFVKAMEVTVENVNEIFPDRKKAKSMVAKLNYDMEHFFINRGPEYFEDITAIYQEFPFDLFIADCAFTAIPFVYQKMQVPVINVGIIPLLATSKDLPPYGLGMLPSTSRIGKWKQQVLRWISSNILFKPSNKVLEKLCADHGLAYQGQNVFDYSLDSSTLMMQSATPGFEYERSDLDPKIHFVGPLLPVAKSTGNKPWFDDRLNRYEKVILLTQGTAEPDVTKLIKPTLEAFKGSKILVVVTTGNADTTALRTQYNYDNIIIESFIPYAEIMPYADVYVTNGGYGGTLLGIQQEVPMVVAGVHEGKSEICARVGYFELGINLKTERPVPHQIKMAVETILNNPQYQKNVNTLANEFRSYKTNEITAALVQNTIRKYKSMR